MQDKTQALSLSKCFIVSLHLVVVFDLERPYKNNDRIPRYLVPATVPDGVRVDWFQLFARRDVDI